MDRGNKKNSVIIISAILSLTKSEMAHIFGVSRPTLYGWLDGEMKPKGDRLERILRVESVVCRCGLKGRLFHAYVREPLPGENESIATLLSQNSYYWEVPRIKRLLKKAWQMTVARDKMIARMMPSVMPSKEQQEQNLRDNLLVLGWEG